MPRPTVAICIPTYNQAAFLEQSVRSALAQTHPCEVWVSDDASTDETPEVMTELQKKYPSLHYIRQHRNLGIKGNPSWVLKQPTTVFIVRLDSDDVLSPTYVERLVLTMEQYPQAGYGHVTVQEIGAGGEKLKLRPLARTAVYQKPEDSLRASVLGYRVAANICMFQRSALQQVNYYNDLSFAEDWDLAVRLADAGWGNAYLPEVLASYRVWDTSTQAKGRRKLDEINGIQAVFERSLLPAHKRRNWDAKRLQNVRRQFALRHADSLRSSFFSAAEKRDLRQALCRLGESAALRWKFHWIETPLAPLMQLPGKIIFKGKSVLKSFLFSKKIEPSLFTECK